MSSEISSAAPTTENAKRAAPRKKTYQAVKWNHRSGEDEGATILDMGAGGIFLTPFGTAPSNLQNGDTVWVSLRPKGHDDDVVLAATIRWRGFSKLHGEIGFGIEFDDHSKEKAAQLMLQMNEKGHFFVPE